MFLTVGELFDELYQLVVKGKGNESVSIKSNPGCMVRSAKYNGINFIIEPTQEMYVAKYREDLINELNEWRSKYYKLEKEYEELESKVNEDMVYIDGLGCYVKHRIK